MNRPLSALALFALLSACGGDGTNPFMEDPVVVDPIEEDYSVESVVNLAGTDNPTAGGSIYHYGTSTVEEVDKQDPENGYVYEYVYNETDDQLTICCLAFDGNPAPNGSSIYARGTAPASIGSFAVYEADIVTPDYLTSDLINQIVPSRAIYKRSAVDVNGSPRTEVVVARSGGYNGPGFGGFVFRRQGGVVLPTAGGEARFEGEYAGVRTFDGIGGIQYSTASLSIDIDFGGFGSNTQTLKSQLSNYTVYDSNGNIVDGGVVDTDIQYFGITIDTSDHLDDQGEVQATISASTWYLNEDETEYIEIEGTGTLYGVIAGNMNSGDGGEMVGVILINWGSILSTLNDPQSRDVIVSETGGFILERAQP